MLNGEPFFVNCSLSIVPKGHIQRGGNFNKIFSCIVIFDVEYMTIARQRRKEFG